MRICATTASADLALPVRALGKCGGYTSDIVDAMRWAAGLPFPREPRVRHLVPADVRNLTDSTGQLSSPQDIAPMGLANHALRTEAEERDTVNTVMRRVLSAIKV